MKPNTFTQQEASAKVGRRVCSSVAFSAIPQQTPGLVVGMREAGDGGFEAVVEWHLPGRYEPLSNSFDKDQCSQLLTELPDSPDGPGPPHPGAGRQDCCWPGAHFIERPSTGRH